MKKFQKATFKKGIAQDEYTLMGLLLPRGNAEPIELKKAYKKSCTFSGSSPSEKVSYVFIRSKLLGFQAMSSINQLIDLVYPRNLQNTKNIWNGE